MNTTKIFGDVPDAERERLLAAHAVRQERTTFTQSLSDDELQIMSAEYIRGSIDLKRMEGQAKESADEWKTKIKASEGKLEESLEIISNGRREVTGILFFIPNQADSKMLIYNKAGELIETRPLKENERQTRAFIDGPGGTIPNPDDSQITDIDHEEVGTAEEQIADMYKGPTIAGTAPAPEGDKEESSRPEIGQFKGGDPSPEEENGMAWDDPRQVRAETNDSAAVEGLKAKKRGRKPKTGTE